MPNCYQSRVIEAPVEVVWEKINNFLDMSWTPNVVASCENIGDVDGNTIGAKRLLNGAIKETLLTFDESNRTFSYSIDEGPSPISSSDVSKYTGVVTLFEITASNQTFMVWKSSWESNSSDAVEFCSGIYAQVMKDLQNTMTT